MLLILNLNNNILNTFEDDRKQFLRKLGILPKLDKAKSTLHPRYTKPPIFILELGAGYAD